MVTLKLDKELIGKGKLILINRTHPLSIAPEERNLVPAYSNYTDIFLDARAATMLSQLISTLNCEGKIVPVSGYRTLQEQESIYNDSMNENGEDFTLKFVAMPNCSEHQTGLAIDLGKNSPDMDFLRPDFPYSGITQRFRERAASYGFIERYQQGKESITGIAHEPWHFRYVGYPHSEIMSKNNLVLEEYTDFIKDYSYEKEHLILEYGTQNIEIFYVEAASNAPVSIALQDGIPYQISGNNTDGFVVTLWRNRS